MDLSFNPGKIVRFESDGSVSGSVQAISALPDGTIVIAGRFDSVGGVARHNIARVRADGTVDPRFDAGEGPQAAQPAMLSLRLWLTGGGGLYVGGNFDSYNGVAQACLVRITASGQLDSKFNAGLFEAVFTGNAPEIRALVSNQGMLAVAGCFKGPKKVLSDLRQYNLEGVDPRGVLSQTFANGNYPIGGISAILRQEDGTFLIGDQVEFALLDSHGDYDVAHPEKRVPVKGGISLMLQQPDGKVLVAGSSLSEINGVKVNGLARLSPSGQLDTEFRPPAITSTANRLIRAIALQPDGAILVGGLFDRVGGVRRYSLARLHPDGSLDETFECRNATDVNAIVVQSDGRILVGTSFHYDQTDPYFQQSTGPMGLVRLHSGACPIGLLRRPKFPQLPYDESGMTSGLRQALTEFEQAVQQRGGRIEKTSGYRSATYQAHLLEIKTNAERLGNFPGIKVVSADRPRQFAATSDLSCCGDVVQEINEEIRMHFNTFPDVVAERSPHTLGVAADWTVSGVPENEVDELAAGCGLRRSVSKEPCHFTLVGEPPRCRAELRGYSPVNLLLQDPSGRRIGYDPTSNRVVNDLGNAASYSGPASSPQIIEIPAEKMLSGQYVVTGIGTDVGEYTIQVRVYAEDDSGNIFERVLARGMAAPGQSLAAIPPLDWVASTMAIHFRPSGRNLVLGAPDWATNAVVEFSPSLVSDFWLPWPTPLSTIHSLVATNLSEPARFFRLRAP